MKYAVYVEGQSEMLFVADVLQKYSKYDPAKVGFKCINLTADIYEAVSYPVQGDLNSDNYYQIVNVNNDNLVVSKLKKDIQGLAANGFYTILGLKDAYSESYQKLVSNQAIVDRDMIEKLHSIQHNTINAGNIDCRLHFAIMEYETWMLALIDNYITSHQLDTADILSQFGLDIDCELEGAVYHPFPLVQKIYQVCGESYHKHGKESLSFLSTLAVDDYERLRKSGRCPSFSKFIDSLLGDPCPDLP